MRHAPPAGPAAAAVLVLAAAFGAITPGPSRADPAMCHTVVDGGGRPVAAAGGAPVLAAASRPCPRPAREPTPAMVAGVVPVAVTAPAPAPSTPAPAPIATIAGDVAFAFDSARLRPALHPVLDEIAAALRREPRRQVAVIGHTDDAGPERYNRELSLRRARAVADYLERAGVAPGRLIVAGDGAGRPVADNATEAGRARNRRVEVAPL